MPSGMLFSKQASLTRQLQGKCLAALALALDDALPVAIVSMSNYELGKIYVQDILHIFLYMRIRCISSGLQH